MSSFRFVHTADLHLDSPLKSLALRDPALAEMVGSATRTALERIVGLCLEERVDALLIAGDLFDGEQQSMKTAAFLAQQMRRLDEAGIRVFVIRGNHDAQAPVTGALALPPNCHVFTGRGGIVEHRGVAVQGVSFPGGSAPESLLPKYRPPRPGMPNIALLHTSLGGAEGHDPYAPCSVADLEAHGTDYWALGHVHARAVHGEAPWIVMPGMPQGRAIDEAGAKSATLVTIGERGIEVVARPTAQLEFARAELVLDPGEDWEGALRRAAAVLVGVSESVSAPAAVVRLRLVGHSSLAWRLRRDLGAFEEQLRALLPDAGGGRDAVFLEAVRLEAVPAVEPASPASPLAGLGALMGEVARDPGFLDEADAYLDRMVQALPPELRDRFGADAAGREAVLAALVTEGEATVLAALHAAEAEEGSDGAAD
ncbi:MAG: DNA repair exonuclease [Pseudomonadota bacterium]